MSLLHSNPTTFLLVRHAQTSWNEKQRHTGSIEVPLSSHAESQIKRLTKKLVSFPIAALYSSPLSRCRITINPTAEIVSLPVSIRIELIERYLGDWEGKCPQDLSPTHPGYHFPDSAYTGQFRIPRAEPLEDLEHRIRTVLHELNTHHAGKTIAISTHSGVIWTILHRIVY